MGAQAVPPESAVVGRELLALAVRGQAEAIRSQLADHPTASPKSFVINISGLPGYQLADLQGARRHDGSIRVHVLALDGTLIDDAGDPLLVDLNEAPDPLQVDDGAVEGKNGSRWTLAPGGLQPEVLTTDDAGMPVTRLVNTDRYGMQMQCGCGNVRYAMRSSIHQVDRCRPCSKRKRHEYQVQWQRNKRKATRNEN